MMKNLFNKIILLITLPLLILGCDNFLDGASSRGKTTAGSFSLSIAEPKAERTIMPTPFAQADMEGYFYTLQFTPIAPTQNDPVTAYRTYANLSDAVPLSVGAWNLVVTAYQDETRLQSIAQGSLSGITINNQAVSGSVELKGIIASGGTGTFSWDLTFAAEAEAMLTITPKDGTPEDPIPLSISNNANAGSQPLNAGYYDIVITVAKNQTQTIELKKTLHIHQNRVSLFTFNFSDEYLNGNVHVITYQYNDGVTPDNLVECTHGDSIVLPLEDPELAGYESVDWCTDAALTAEYDDAPVIADMTLYARWNGFTSVQNISEYLQKPSNEGTITDPLPIKAELDLGDLSLTENAWRDLLTALGTAEDYVDLDISACTIAGDVFNHNNYIDYNIVDTMEYLSAIRLPDSVTSIGENAFSYTSLTEITIPDSVISIGESAFSYTSLTEITIPDSVTSISQGAFERCISLTGITLPDSVTSIGGYVFTDCTGLTEITMPADLISIGQGAFERCTNLANITLPENLAAVDSGAFNGCTGLTGITLPASVTSIGSGAFRGCTGLTGITLPENLAAIDSDAFNGCTGFTEITLPADLASIGSSAFRDCTGLTGITLPENENFAAIDSDVFNGCTGLISITLPNNVTSIGDNAFNGCTGLTGITMPESITSIGSGAFTDCTGLSSITLSENVTSIGGNAFQRCTGLTEITLPDSVNNLGDSVFRDCTGLSSITLSENITSIGGGAFRGCTSLTSITLHEGITYIGSYAFQDCTGLNAITLPNTLNTIAGPYAFRGCAGLTEITLPESLGDIGMGTFWNCTVLEYVICLRTEPPAMGMQVFDGAGLKNIHVPAGTVAAYQAATGWKDNASMIIEIQ